jgi:methyltransferase-like protein/2-polyprenyl-3-methyl-5-hydroxy-6-metoxy-1,4-benzoquinol methylase
MSNIGIAEAGVGEREEVPATLGSSDLAAGSRAPMNSYDQVPYQSHPFVQCTPDRLAVIATLHGIKPAPPARCRVLELGCSSGGNLLPLAERFPDSEFLGIDGSARQAAAGREAVEHLGLCNIQLEHRDILEVGPELGKFDYIITHGVFSWVPPRVQEKILRICTENLSPNGVAYVSYNAYPGWHMRGIIRDMMLYRARPFDKPVDRVRHARALVDFLAESVPAEDNAYGILLRSELESLRRKEDHYLFHEHLEACNQPFYFHQFMELATASGLQYVGEADYGAMSLGNVPPAALKVLNAVAEDRLALEQYMDFLRNRMFRQTLLCHNALSVDEEIAAERALGLYVSSPAKPETQIVDVRSRAKAVFRGAGAVTTTTEPVMKAAMLHLAEIWPRAVSVTELIAVARSRVNPVAALVDVTRVSADSRKLVEPLLRCYATGQVEFTASPSSFTTIVSQRPTASQLARRQAQSSHRVTNLRHESVTLDDLHRHVLRHLDGKSDRAALLGKLAELVAQGSLMLREDGRPIEEANRVRETLDSPLSAALSMLAGNALLTA